MIKQGNNTLTLKDVLYIPSIPQNLLSVIIMKKLGIYLDTKTTPGTIQNSEGPILHAYDEDGKSAIYSDQQAAAAEGNIAIDYHERYGHFPFQFFSHIPEAHTRSKMKKSNVQLI
jgi:hypothetical protein